MRRLVLLSAVAWVCATSVTLAQADGFARGDVEIDIGGVWQGQVPMGTVRATLTGNQTGTPPVTFFNTSTRLEPSPGVDTRVAVFLSRVFAIEGGFRYARPRLETSISGDIEDAVAIVATQDIMQYVVELNGVAHMRRIGRAVPFVFGGAAYLRELYSGRQIVETGRMYQFGGGVKIMFRETRRGFLKGLGIRADGRFLMRQGGVELDEDEPLRTYGAAGGGLILVF